MIEHHDSDLGRILIVRRANAKRAIARIKSNHIQFSVPTFYGKEDILNSIESLKPKLMLRLLASPQKPNLILEDTVFETSHFKATISRKAGLKDQAKMQLDGDTFNIFIPEDANICDPAYQAALKKLLMNAMQYRAAHVLPIKVVRLAKQHNKMVRDVKISRGRSRWGSCSSNKVINLSLFLMLLPDECIDYVILHELAHTVEMNHSERFWKVLNEMYGSDSREFDRHIKKHVPPQIHLFSE